MTLGLHFAESATCEAMSRAAAKLVLAQLEKQPDLLFCASAGGTPTRLYEFLAAEAAVNPRKFARMRLLLIDEWGGLPPGHQATCKEDVSAKLARPLRIAPSRFVAFDTAAQDPAAECRRIAEFVARRGPIDICILGLGKNGHIGMVEPGPDLEPLAHVAKLAPSSLRHPMLKAAPHRPDFGLTLGLTEILNSRQVLLLVSGEHKRAALTRLREPRVTTSFPASLLWLHHNATVLCDSAAAGSTSSTKD